MLALMCPPRCGARSLCVLVPVAKLSRIHRCVLVLDVIVYGRQTPPVAQLYQGQDAAAQAKVRERLAEWDGAGGLYGFDSWVANTDRNERNLLFSGDKEVWLIDHGHCFTGPNWTPANLDPTKEFSNKLKRWLTPVMSDARRAAVASEAAKLPETVKGVDLEKLGEMNHVASILDRGESQEVCCHFCGEAYNLAPAELCARFADA